MLKLTSKPEYLAKNIDRWALKNKNQLADDFVIKHQRRFTKYERELVRCGSDIQALERFIKTQTIASERSPKIFRCAIMASWCRFKITYVLIGSLSIEMDWVYNPWYPSL
jgi:hypothetical protein